MIYSVLASKIEKFLTDPTEDGISLEMQPVSDIFDTLYSVGFNKFKSDGADLNGFSVDFWYYLTHPKFPDKKFCLSGSLWYGRFKFYLDEDED